MHWLLEGLGYAEKRYVHKAFFGFWDSSAAVKYLRRQERKKKRRRAREAREKARQEAKARARAQNEDGGGDGGDAAIDTAGASDRQNSGNADNNIEDKKGDDDDVIPGEVQVAVSWRRVDGTLNMECVTRITDMISTLVVTYPGISLSNLRKRLCMLTPAEARKMVLLMKDDDKLRTRTVLPSTHCDLFASSSAMCSSSSGRRERERMQRAYTYECGQLKERNDDYTYLFPTTHSI